MPPTTAQTTIPSTITNAPLLSDVFASRQSAAFADTSRCEIDDITPDSPGGSIARTSGFDIPAEAAPLVGDVWLRIVPVETSDLEMERKRVELLEETLEIVSEFFREQSYDLANLLYFSEEESDWVQFSETGESLGFVGSEPKKDMAALMEAILLETRPSEDSRDTQLVLALLPPEPSSTVEQATRRFQLDLVNGMRLENGILMSASFVTNWKVLAHELGHSWLRSEDLYQHSYFGSGQDFFGRWDIMSMASGPDPEFSSWFRWRSGWLSDDQVYCIEGALEVEFFLQPLQTKSGLAKSAMVRLSDHSLLVIEVREHQYSRDIAETLLVYVVDTSFEHGNGPFRLVGTIDEDGQDLDWEDVTIRRSQSDSSGMVVTVISPT